ncbi:hypothetical protein FGIG_00250 [Fasciola gigantica]|uniref:EF-hand domain-containing protein n=1 Tax=Fasciola gigantica TaxID=46835 RepID=A0A504Z0A1_FASGI|nr:hypothetical protein FGIG_00250 [Fasciola gigantica]
MRLSIVNKLFHLFRRGKFAQKTLRETQLRDLEVRFNKIDRNHDGQITRDEFIEELRENSLPIQLADSFVALYDANGDGCVSKQEYINAFSKFDLLTPQVSVEDKR